MSFMVARWRPTHAVSCRGCCRLLLPAASAAACGGRGPLLLHVSKVAFHNLTN